MFLKILVSGVLAAALTGAPAGAQTGVDDLGVIEFPTSGSADAQPHFLRGVKYLHNFQFDDAADAFMEAQRLDPGFAMAYWGEAMSYNHPLWASVNEQAGRRALEKLAPTPEARLARAGTAKERAYLQAVDRLFGEGDKLERDLAYSELMSRVHEQWPDDHEVATFYALSLLGTVRPGDQGFYAQMLAGSIAQQVFRENPLHPGAVHFIIHAFDDPQHAPLALYAARVYAEIAPASAHALHMPSHIFLQRGMWRETVESNNQAYAASVAWATRRGETLARTDFHSLSWEHYAYLQLGETDRAAATLETIAQVARDTGDPRVLGNYHGMRARHVLETRNWEIVGAGAGATRSGGGAHAMHSYDGSAALMLASGISAAHLGNLDAAEDAQGQLRSLAEQAEAGGRTYRAQNLRIMEKEVGAVIALVKGHGAEAVRLLHEAVELESKMDPPSGPPDPIKPSHELLGEVLLELDRPAEAAEQFDEALRRMPNRSLSLLGAARAAASLGDTTTARRHYQDLSRNWASADLPDAGEARQFLGASQDQ